MFAFFCGYLAGQKNRDSAGWFVLGFLFSFIALLVLIGAPVAEPPVVRLPVVAPPLGGEPDRTSPTLRTRIIQFEFEYQNLFRDDVPRDQLDVPMSDGEWAHFHRWHEYSPAAKKFSVADRQTHWHLFKPDRD